MNTLTLRPGFLVSLKTTLKGNVQYLKAELSYDVQRDGAAVSRWETTKIVADPVELEQAKKVRSKVASLIRSACSTSAFGYLCPDKNAEELERMILAARAVAQAFNKTAKTTRVGVYVMTGRIANNDVEAVRAINSEVRDLLSAMEQGVKALDPAAIRDAANKARSLSAMLTDDASKKVKRAIDAARSAARGIVKAGERAAVAVDQEAMKAIGGTRLAFLDLDNETDMETVKALPTGRMLELDPDVAAASADYVAKAKGRNVEMES